MKARPPTKAKPTKAAAIDAGSNRRRRIGDPCGPDWNLSLYIAGRTLKSETAFRNLKRICELHLNGRYQIDVIDLVKNPQIAREDQVVAVPTLVRKQPAPLRKIIGDLSNTERVLAALDLQPKYPC